MKTIKTNLILNTKIIYFSEKIMESDYPELLTLDTLVSLPGMSREEILEVINIFEQKGIIKRETEYKEVEAINDWIKVDTIYFNKELLKDYVIKLKKKGLRGVPLMQREEIFAIAKYIENIFTKDELAQIFSSLHERTSILSYFTKKEYNLTDLLFWYSFSKEESLISVLVEFLKPTYYDISSEVERQKMFIFFDRILFSCTPSKDYLNWKKKTLKHIKKETLVKIDDYKMDMSKPKITINVCREKGISRNRNGHNVFYTRMQPKSKVFKTILFLIESKGPIDISELANCTRQKDTIVKEAIKRFNRNSKRIFGIKSDIIFDNDSGIYFPNRDDYQFL